MRFVLALIAILSSVLVATGSESNAKRMARGLSPNRPARLFDPSRPRALQARASLSANPTFIVAAGPPPSRKREAPGFFAIAGDSLRFATSQGDAASFFWEQSTYTATYPTTLKWTAPATTSDFVMGQTYTVYAQPMGSIWKVKIGTPTNSITRIFTGETYQGQLNPYIGYPPATQLWIAGPNGDLYFAPDVATAVDALGGSVTVLLTQAIPTGQTPTIAAATAATAAQQALLVNPVSLYMRDAEGTYATYISVYSNGYIGGGATIYLSDYVSGAPGRAIAVAGGNTLVASSNYLANGVVRPSFNPLATANNTMKLTVTGLAGRVYPSIDGTPYTWYRSFQNSLFACADPATCTAYQSDAQEICLEAVVAGGTPSVCDQWADEQFNLNYENKRALYVYDPQNVWSGYWAFSSDYDTTTGLTIVPDQSSATWTYTAKSDLAYVKSPQQLFARNKAGRVFTFQSAPISVLSGSKGVATFQAAQLASAPPSIVELQLSMPYANTRQYLQVNDYINQNPTTTSWHFYVSGTSYPFFNACQSLGECNYVTTGVREVCVEVIPEGGAPVLCTPARFPL